MSPVKTRCYVIKSTLTQIPAADVSQATGVSPRPTCSASPAINQATVLWARWDTLGAAAGGYDAAQSLHFYT